MEESVQDRLEKPKTNFPDALMWRDLCRGCDPSERACTSWEGAMSATMQSSKDTLTESKTFRKVFRRLIWFLFLALVVSFMDRINIAFAALTMNKDLALSATAYGM